MKYSLGKVMATAAISIVFAGFAVAQDHKDHRSGSSSSSNSSSGSRSTSHDSGSRDTSSRGGSHPSPSSVGGGVTWNRGGSSQGAGSRQSGGNTGGGVNWNRGTANQGGGTRDTGTTTGGGVNWNRGGSSQGAGSRQSGGNTGGGVNWNRGTANQGGGTRDTGTNTGGGVNWNRGTGGQTGGTRDGGWNRGGVPGGGTRSTGSGDWSGRFNGTRGMTDGNGTRDSHNYAGSAERNPGRFHVVPPVVEGRSLRNRVLDHERVGLVRGGYRDGYYHYNRGYRDDHFFFGFYIFSPWDEERCVCSPWYYYSCLPPYVAYHHVVFVDRYYSDGWVGVPYDWHREYVDEQQSEVNYAVHDIVAAFQDGDRRALSHLVPQDGKVNIYTEGNYSYSMTANEFFDLYKDGIENVHTDSYTIEHVERNDRGDARVIARHEYTDPWGDHQVVYHSYYLAREGRDYVIREFGTSYYDKGF